MWSKHGMVWYRLREAFSGFANAVDGLSKPKGPSFECAARHSFPPSASSLAICVCSRASSKPRNFSRDARVVFADAAGASFDGLALCAAARGALRSQQQHRVGDRGGNERTRARHRERKTCERARTIHGAQRAYDIVAAERKTCERAQTMHGAQRRYGIAAAERKTCERAQTMHGAWSAHRCSQHSQKAPIGSKTRYQLDQNPGIIEAV